MHEIFHNFLSSFRSLLLVGPTGTGKTVYVQDKMMKGLDKEIFVPSFVAFSTQTSSGQAQVGINL